MINNLEEYKKAVELGQITKKVKWYYQYTNLELDDFAKEIKLVEILFKELFNLPIYLVYGTLLGAIRDKNFIMHDYDVDLAYLSQKTELSDIIEEYKSIIKTLTQYRRYKLNFYQKKFRKGQIKTWVNNSSYGEHLDVWVSYIKDNKYYCAALNRALTNEDNLSVDLILPLKTIKFRKEKLLIPQNSEKLLNYVFPNWQIPYYDGQGKSTNIKEKTLFQIPHQEMESYLKQFPIYPSITIRNLINHINQLYQKNYAS